tara:strand:- start:387 stop:686 length:300 start_codon:yes stop_codon:yes gene_type:complete
MGNFDRSRARACAVIASEVDVILGLFRGGAGNTAIKALQEQRNVPQALRALRGQLRGAEGRQLAQVQRCTSLRVLLMNSPSWHNQFSNEETIFLTFSFL